MVHTIGDSIKTIHWEPWNIKMARSFVSHEDYATRSNVSISAGLGFQCDRMVEDSHRFSTKRRSQMVLAQNWNFSGCLWDCECEQLVFHLDPEYICTLSCRNYQDFPSDRSWLTTGTGHHWRYLLFVIDDPHLLKKINPKKDRKVFRKVFPDLRYSMFPQLHPIFLSFWGLLCHLLGAAFATV